jgi:hypothetical protein
VKLVNYSFLIVTPLDTPLLRIPVGILHNTVYEGCWLVLLKTPLRTMDRPSDCNYVIGFSFFAFSRDLYSLYNTSSAVRDT